MADTASTGSARSEPQAGWRCREEGSYPARLEKALRIPPGTKDRDAGPARQFRWSLFTGRQARNEKLAKLHDPSNDQRRAWMADRHGDDLIVSLDLPSDRASFLVLGDPGEGDASQFAVVEPLLRIGADTDFMVVASDVVYPAGDVNDYRRNFYSAYRDYTKPIYAVPGNHDWDDGGLHGFMFHFCGRDDEPPGILRAVPALLRPVWRRPAAPEPATAEARAARRAAVPQPLQPGPYFALDAGPVLVLGADLGLRGSLDRDQADWLRRLARADPRPKVLVAGKPVWYEGKYGPPPVEGGGTLDDIVREPAHGFVAVVSGEIHNYQRYPVPVEGGRTIQYVVAGGGGAFTQGTHTVGAIDAPNPNPSLPRIRERDVRMYPLRGDSLSFFSQLYAAKVAELAGSRRGRLVARILGRRGIVEPAQLWIRPAAAEAIVSGWLGTPPERETVEPTTLERRAADVVRWLPTGKFSEIYYPFWDWDRPPFFKSFLRIDATTDEIRLRCFAATGCAEHEADPPLEDEVCWTRAGGWLSA